MRYSKVEIAMTWHYAILLGTKNVIRASSNCSDTKANNFYCALPAVSRENKNHQKPYFRILILFLAYLSLRWSQFRNRFTKYDSYGWERCGALQFYTVFKKVSLCLSRGTWYHCKKIALFAIVQCGELINVCNSLLRDVYLSSSIGWESFFILDRLLAARLANTSLMYMF